MAEKEPFAVQAAKFSLFAPLIAIAANIAARASSMPQQSLVVIGFVSLGLYIAALTLGVAALFGMRRHGRKGILVQAILGVTVNTLIIILCMVLLLTGLARARKAASERAADANLKPFTFTVPPGFAEFPEGKRTSPDIVQCYIKGDPHDQAPDIILLVEDLGGRITRQDMSKYVRGKSNVRLIEERWKGYDIPVFEIRESLGALKTLTYNAQVPVLPKAVQIKVVGPASLEAELRTTLKEALEGIEGTTNW